MNPALLLVALLGLAASAPSPARAPPAELRALSDKDVAAYAATRLDLRHLPPYHFALGALAGVPVWVDLFCSDVCPDYTKRVIHLEPLAGETCASSGGVEKGVEVPFGIGAREETFCLPKVLAKQP